jgi:roadblock/LC7 domain-containing protein
MLHRKLRDILEIPGVDSALEFRLDGEMISYESNGRNITQEEAKESAKQLATVTNRILEVNKNAPSHEQFSNYKHIFSPPRAWIFFAGNGPYWYRWVKQMQQHY